MKLSYFCTANKIEDEMGGNLMGRSYLQNVGINQKIILKQNFSVRSCDPDSSSLGQGSAAGCYKHGQEFWLYKKRCVTS
jgi:hypothetical protein